MLHTFTIDVRQLFVQWVTPQKFAALPSPPAVVSLPCLGRSVPDSMTHGHSV